MNRGNSSLAGRVAIVTGGASGIGRALAEEIAGRGGEVVLADRQIDLAREVAEGIVQRSGRATSTELDVRDFDAFRALAKATAARTGRIDYLFNNAGIGVGGEMDSYRKEDWDSFIDVNLRGVAYGVKAVYPIMIAQRSGHIINTASMAGLMPAPGQGSYTATKHAVVGLSKALRVEAKRHGVRVSALCPGAIRTPILTGGKYGRNRVKGLTEEVATRFWKQMRPMEPDAFAVRVMDAVLRDEAIIIEPRWWKTVWYLDRLSPSFSMRVARVMLERTRKEFAAAGIVPEGPEDDA